MRQGVRCVFESPSLSLIAAGALDARRLRLRRFWLWRPRRSALATAIHIMALGYGPYGGYGAYPGYYGGLGYGWYDNYYYPGTGIYVYDSYRRPHMWNDRQRSYWSNHRTYLCHADTTNWSGFRTRSTSASLNRTHDSRPEPDDDNGREPDFELAANESPRPALGWSGLRRTTADQHDRDEGHHHVAVLVGDGRLRSEGAHLGPAARRRLLEDPAAHVQRVAGIDRLLPAQLVDPGRAEAGLLVLDDVPGDHRHGHRRGVPAARRDAGRSGSWRLPRRTGGTAADRTCARTRALPRA